MQLNYFYVFVFIIFGSLFVTGMLFLSKLIQPRSSNHIRNQLKGGLRNDVGHTRSRFNIRIQVLILSFIVLETASIFLLLWAIVIKKLGMPALLSMMLFCAIIMVGIIYLWGRGDMQWDTELNSCEDDTEEKEQTDTIQSSAVRRKL